MDLEGNERNNTAKESAWLSNMSVWEDGSSAAWMGKWEKSGLKEAIIHSGFFVDGSGHMDVKVKVDNPDGGVDWGYSHDEGNRPCKWMLRLRKE